MNKLIIPVYFLIDFSNSDNEFNVVLNKVVDNSINELKHIAMTQTDYSNIMINIYGYYDRVSNITNGFINVNTFKLEHLQTDGQVNFGIAIEELDNDFSVENLSKLGTCTKPIIVFVIYSEPTDDYVKALLKIKGNELFQVSEKIVVLIERNQGAMYEFKNFLGEYLVIAPDDFFDKIHQIIIGNHQGQYSGVISSTKQELTAGNIVKTYHGVHLKIEKLIGEGGSSKVFLVDYQGKKRALKVYNYADQNGKYILKRFSDMVTPDDSFLWIYDLVELESNNIGYIMDLRPEDYYEFYYFLAGSSNAKIIKFNSYNICIMSAINIMIAFRKLHQIGYCCLELNDGDIFINPKNGNVLINIVDKISASGEFTKTVYKPRSMAPELIVSDSVRPDAWTDRFSLAIIVFKILFASHPLEGKKWCVSCITDKIAKELYGTNPIFVFDKDDDSNRPDERLHAYLLYAWYRMPEYAKDIFLKSFSKEALYNPQKRLRENDWIEVLTRLYNDTIRCECENYVFYSQDNKTICDKCNELVNVEYVLSGKEYDIPIVKGHHILNTKATWFDYYNKSIFKVVTKDDSRLYLVNISSKTIECLTPSGRRKEVKNNYTIPVIDGITVIIANVKWKIKKIED